MRTTGWPSSTRTVPQSGLAPVSENGAWAAGTTNHSCWMLLNGIAHDERRARPDTRADGDAGRQQQQRRRVERRRATLPKGHIDLWMSGPFHAIGILRPNLTQTSYGQCSSPPNPTATPWKSAATLDVIRGTSSGSEAVDADRLPRQRCHHQPDPVRRRVARSAFVLRLDRTQRRTAAHRPDAGSRSTSAERDLDRSERSGRHLCPHGREHVRRRQLDPRRRQCRRRPARRSARQRHLHGVGVIELLASPNWSFNVDPNAAARADEAPPSERRHPRYGDRLRVDDTVPVRRLTGRADHHPPPGRATGSDPDRRPTGPPQRCDRGQRQLHHRRAVGRRVLHGVQLLGLAATGVDAELPSG